MESKRFIKEIIYDENSNGYLRTSSYDNKGRKLSTKDSADFYEDYLYLENGSRIVRRYKNN